MSQKYLEIQCADIVHCVSASRPNMNFQCNNWKYPDSGMLESQTLSMPAVSGNPSIANDGFMTVLEESPL